MNFNPKLIEGYGEIIVASIIWSFAGIFAKQVVGMSAFAIIFYRVLFAFIILLIIISLTKNLEIIKLKDKKKYLILFSVLQVVTMITFFTSILEVSVSVSVLLLYTAPVYVAAFSPLILKENLTKKGIIALIISMIGIVFIVEPENIEFSNISIGIISGIISGISFAFQVMTSKYISSSYSGRSQAFWSFLIASILLFPKSIVTYEVIYNNIVPLILLAVFPTILSVSLYFNGLKKVKASSASILGLLEPLSAVVLAVIILDEKLSNVVILGGIFILIGALIVMKK